MEVLMQSIEDRGIISFSGFHLITDKSLSMGYAIGQVEESRGNVIMSNFSNRPPTFLAGITVAL